MGAAVSQERAPASGRRRTSEAEKAHGGLGQHRSSHSYGSLHDHRLNDVWQYVPREHAPVIRAECAGRFYIFPLARREDLSSHQARVSDPSANAKSEDQVENTGAEERDEG